MKHARTLVFCEFVAEAWFGMVKPECLHLEVVALHDCPGFIYLLDNDLVVYIHVQHFYAGLHKFPDFWRSDYIKGFGTVYLG